MHWTRDEYAIDPRPAFDALRERCPVARGSDGSWMVGGHAEAVECALSTEALSNHVSSRLQIPNGLDGDEHRRFRALVDQFFSSSEIARLAPRFATIADDFVATLPRAQPLDAVWQIGAVLAVRFQSAWLGWPAELEPALLRWMADYRAGLRSNEAATRAEVAARFDAIVTAQIERARLRATTSGRNSKAGVATDVTTQLLQARVDDPGAPGGQRPLETPEILSILRNWTAGDLGTVAACLGVVAHRVAVDAELQFTLRQRLDDASFVHAVIDECLRIDDPFLWNRRKATADVVVADQVIPAGATVIINWMAANRDPRRFPSPDAFSPATNAPHNLVYGVGPHVCPGRELATVQLREGLAALLRASNEMNLIGGPSRSRTPTGGYDRVCITLS